MSTDCKGFAYALTRLLCPLTPSTLSDILAIVAHNHPEAGGCVLVGMVDATDTDLLCEGDGGSMGTLTGRGGLQNASVLIQNSAHKTQGGRHDDGGDGDVDVVK